MNRLKYFHSFRNFQHFFMHCSFAIKKVYIALGMHYAFQLGHV